MPSEGYLIDRGWGEWVRDAEKLDNRKIEFLALAPVGARVVVAKTWPMAATTLGKIVIVREDIWNGDKRVLASTLRHEAVHVKQQQSMGWGNSWIGCFNFILLYAFLPFPFLFAYFRKKWEVEGYSESLWTWTLMGATAEELDKAAEKYAKKICGIKYGFAWYSWRNVKNELCEHLRYSNEHRS